MVETVDTNANSAASADIPECVMNDKVRNFEPTLEDIFFIIPSGDYQRLLF